MHELIDGVFRPAFGGNGHANVHDGALLAFDPHCLAFTTDSFVVKPLFFPGGDIGTLAVYGTVNDLAMCGAQPKYLSIGLILEEGLELDILQRVSAAIGAAAGRCGVEVVTGDTKVVERGHGDGLYVNTAGVGTVRDGVRIEPRAITPGDAVLLSGDLGRHGIAVMAAREGLGFETRIESDLAPLAAPAHALLDAGIDVHCFRDLTRGGLGAAVIELAEAAEVGFTLDERSIPVHEEVRGACEILGLDSIYVANEGRFVAVLAADDAERALAILRDNEVTAGACLVGFATDTAPGQVRLRTALGVERILDMPSGEQLPRIC
jgi:hydrogenase expression/formation protein HypE